MASRKEDVRGYRDYCFYYEPCPICYGCRNYNAAYCPPGGHYECSRDVKNNVCTSQYHTPENFAKVIQRPVVNLTDYYKDKKKEELNKNGKKER